MLILATICDEDLLTHRALALSGAGAAGFIGNATKATTLAASGRAALTGRPPPQIALAGRGAAAFIGNPLAKGAFAASGIGDFQAAAPTPPWSPSSLTGLKGWWDASDSGTVVDDGTGKCSQWNDKSSLGNNLTQATSGSRPTITAAGLNSKTVLTFAGAQKLQNNSATGLPDNSAGYTTLVVAKETATGAWFFYVGLPSLGADAIRIMSDANWYGLMNNGTLLSFNAVAALGTAANVLTSQLSASVASEYLNGTVASNVGSGYSHNYTGNTNIGVGDTLNGFIAEVVLSTGTATSDRQKLEGYAAWKWGLQSQLPAGHPYKSAAP